jgi:hypothetical protein
VVVVTASDGSRAETVAVPRHHDQAACVVGEPGGFIERRAAASARPNVALTVSPAPV